MKTFVFKDKEYRIDDQGFLLDPNDWDEDYAEGMAPTLDIRGGLEERHWRIISHIRRTCEETNECPLVYQTCKECDLELGDLIGLFPTGYLRGACKLAGRTYRESSLGQSVDREAGKERPAPEDLEKVYRVDLRGFLIDPSEWDARYAIFKAAEMKMPEFLIEKHWKIIHFLRDYYRRHKDVPTVYETCRANGLEMDDMERLFPDGYHRGAVKIAGLRAR